MRKLAENQWDVVTKDSEPLELGLALCTGIFAYGKAVSIDSYLTVHTGPFQCGNQPITVMNEVMNTKIFLDASGQPISLFEILQYYKAHHHTPDTELGIYLCSGTRANVTDLAIARFIVATTGYHLMGAELNRPTKAILLPDKAVIECYQFPGRDLLNTFNIGERYEPNIRT